MEREGLWEGGLVERPAGFGRLAEVMAVLRRWFDLMIANRGDHVFLVVNASRKADEIAHLRAHLGGTCAVEEIADRALIALQGPEAEAALSDDFRPEAVAELAADPAGMIGDLHGSPEYRAHLIGVLTRRAVAAAA